MGDLIDNISRQVRGLIVRERSVDALLQKSAQLLCGASGVLASQFNVEGASFSAGDLSALAGERLTFPLEADGRRYGQLVLCVTEISDEDRALIEETAALLSFAISARCAQKEFADQSASFEEICKLAKIGSWRVELATGLGTWTAETARIHDTEPSCGLVDIFKVGLGFFRGEAKTRLEQAIQEAATNGTPYELELGFSSATGATKWIRTTGTPEYTNGKITHIKGACQDISERKNFEIALFSERTQLRTLLDTIPDLVWLKDPHGVYLGCNKRFEQLYGAPERDIIGKNDFDFVDPDVASYFRENDAFAIKLRRSSRNEEMLVFKSDGHKELTETTKTPMYNKEGELVGVLGIGRDISERKRVEGELQASKEKYRALVDSLDDIIFSIDTNRVCTFVNQAVSVLGYPPEYYIGRRLDDLLPAQDISQMEARTNARLQGKPLGPVEVKMLSKDGRPFFFRVNTRAMIEDGVLVGLTGIMVDLTQQRETEEQLRAAQKMEAIGRLAGGVAHDFNNILSVILSYSEMALLGLRPDDPLRDDLQEIANSAVKGGRLTHQLLAFSRRQVLQPEVLSLNDLSCGLMAMLSRLIGEDIQLKIIKTLAPDRIKADRGQIEQVIMNLVVNARDAMPKGGSLRITVDSCEVNKERAQQLEILPGSYAVLSVTDTGCGMDDATRYRIFEPFFTTKSTGKGTGLGLSTVYGIIKQSNGGIEVESRLGHGSTFRIFLPCYSDGLAVESKPSPISILRGQETILVVEDELSLRNVFRRSLSAAGYNVLLAANAEEALQIAEKKHTTINLLVTDVVMPGINGYELAEKILGFCPYLKILYTSGYTDNISAHQPIDNFLAKPFDWQTLASKVRQAIDN